MIKNYFKVAWRNLAKNKAFSAINIIGLAVGMAACIIIMLFVFYEKSFDNFHTKNVYRLNEVQKFPGMVASQKVALSMFPMGPALQNEFPEIRNFTRIKWDGKYQITYVQKKVFLPQVFAVDSTFLQIFDFKLLKGDRKTALKNPHSILITEETAKKLFGDVDPIGKTINHFGGDTATFAVTGVLADIPKNSQLQFDAIYSFSTIYKPWMLKNWGGNWLNTYFVLAPDVNVAALEKKFPAFLKRHINGDGYKYYELFLLPLKEVHAGATDIGLDYINFQKFDQNTTNLFAIIAGIVLLIACINFMNLSTARSAERAREVGVRKSVGAYRGQLAIQFLSETVLLSLLSLVFAMIIVAVALPYVSDLSQRDISLPLYRNAGFIMTIILSTVVVGILSGIYPSVFLSSFQPVKVLKGSVETGRNKGTFRNILVIGQFASAVFLMIATIFVLKQLKYMQSQDPGFVRDQIVTVPFDDVTYKKYDLLKQELSSSSLILGVTAAQDILGSHLDQSGIGFTPTNGPKRSLTSTRLIVDPDYMNVYKIQLAEGRNFSKEKSVNGREYIINEALAKELLKDQKNAPERSLLGSHFGFDSLGTIVGIAKNFNFNSLHYHIETMFMFSQKDWGYSNMSVKISGSRAGEAIALIKKNWINNFPDHPFEYQFLDDHFNEVYRADSQVSQIVGILAGLAIFISCLGLFGLASYSAEKRVKEIGVRKVLGASVQRIVLLLSGNFLKLVLIANTIAWPTAWYAMHAWLSDYAYRIDITWMTFALVALVSVLIALLTISFQSVKAAIANPVKSLRSE